MPVANPDAANAEVLFDVLAQVFSVLREDELDDATVQRRHLDQHGSWFTQLRLLLEQFVWRTKRAARRAEAALAARLVFARFVILKLRHDAIISERSC